MLMMMPVMSRPPKGTLLRRRAAEERQKELKRPTCLITPMRKIAMKGPSNAELANKKHKGTQTHGPPGNSRPKYGEARHVQKDEKDARKGYTKASMHKF
jgi:hypothetical protein